MISNDFNLLEAKTKFMLVIVLFPIAYGGCAAMLVIWLGPEGLICFGMPIVFAPIILAVSKLIGKNLESMNKYKDKRVRMVNDMVELLKQVKMYAWEHFF